MTKPTDRLADRDLSWLAFNERVLQEAADERVPLVQRLHFLAIYSSNLDEFFRVRVASLRSLMRLKPKRRASLGVAPARLLREVNQVVLRQQEEFGRLLRHNILPALEQKGLVLADVNALTPEQRASQETYFIHTIRPHLHPTLLDDAASPLALKNRTSYLVTELWGAGDEPLHGLLEVPAPPADRFVLLQEVGGVQGVLFLDDLLRLFMPALYPGFEIGQSYAVKLSRDAELYLEDEYAGDLVEAIRKGLTRRDWGVPCRFLYDPAMPFALAVKLKERLSLHNEDMVPGGRYHNLHDLFAFPTAGRSDIVYEPQPPHPVPALDASPSLFAAMEQADRLLHFPYQSYAYVVRFFQEAAADPDVEAIWVSLYRLASDSAIAQALIDARRQGKEVTAFVEVKARFDEASNLIWADQMEAAGVRVLYNMPGLKVHAKIALVRRRVGAQVTLYAYLGTGNFNEKTARLYVDEALLTADPRLTHDVRRVFSYLEEKKKRLKIEHLLVAPFSLRKALYRLIDREIEHAGAGRSSGIVLKLNSLEDEKIIGRLYTASRAGVPIRIVVRGICRLVPGVPGQSETITVTSIVDRYLEHARLYLFNNAGDEVYYLASADWMERNLSRRVEVAFPLYDPALQHELRALLELQLADNTKARRIDAGQINAYVETDGPSIRAQYASYALLHPLANR